MEPFFGLFATVATIGSAIALVVWANRRQNRRKAELLTRVSAIMEDPARSEKPPRVRGRVRGYDTELRLAMRGSGKNQQPWTELEVRMGELPAVFEVRPETRIERTYVKKGLALDLHFDEPEFDDKFIVEAAPVDVARILLDDRTRGDLIALHPVKLRYMEKEGRVFLEKHGWPLKEHEGPPLVDLAVHVASRLPEAFGEADAALGEETGSPYRPAQDSRAVREAKVNREIEVDRLEGVRIRRAEHQKRVQTIAIIVGVVVFAVIIVLNILSKT